MTTTSTTTAAKHNLASGVYCPACQGSHRNHRGFTRLTTAAAAGWLNMTPAQFAAANIPAETINGRRYWTREALAQWTRNNAR